MKKFSAGSKKIPCCRPQNTVDITSDDEIGEVAASIEKTVRRLKDYIIYIDEITQVLNEVAKGNLIFTLKQDYAGEFGKVKDALLNISHTLKEMIQGIRTTAVQVSGGANQIAQAAQSLAEGAANQAESVEELTSSVAAISSQVHGNAIYAKDAAMSADLVKDNIKASNEEMREMVKAMEEISECSDAIGRIIGNIEEIADQTNLLSLNASIEAARAGEHGKGFAVVADEVGNLSKESVAAVQMSTELIQNTLHAVQRGMDLVQVSADRLSKSVDGVLELTERMNGLADAAEKQKVSLDEVEQGINRIAAVVTDNSAMSEESAASGEELSAQVSSLKEMIGNFRIEE